jgi:ribosomal protein S14
MTGSGDYTENRSRTDQTPMGAIQRFQFSRRSRREIAKA